MGVSQKMSEKERNIVVPLIISGFKVCFLILIALLTPSSDDVMLYLHKLNKAIGWILLIKLQQNVSVLVFFRILL